MQMQNRFLESADCCLMLKKKRIIFLITFKFINIEHISKQNKTKQKNPAIHTPLIN